VRAQFHFFGLPAFQLYSAQLNQLIVITSTEEKKHQKKTNFFFFFNFFYGKLKRMQR